MDVGETLALGTFLHPIAANNGNPGCHRSHIRSTRNLSLASQTTLSHPSLCHVHTQLPPGTRPPLAAPMRKQQSTSS